MDKQMHTQRTIKKAPTGDWHPADIIAALKKTGTNLSALSAQNGYSRNGLRNALYRHYPKAERMIAEAIGVSPAEIWGSRYTK